MSRAHACGTARSALCVRDHDAPSCGSRRPSLALPSLGNSRAACWTSSLHDGAALCSARSASALLSVCLLRCALVRFLWLTIPDRNSSRRSTTNPEGKRREEERSAERGLSHTHRQHSNSAGNNRQQGHREHTAGRKERTQDAHSTHGPIGALCTAGSRVKRFIATKKKPNVDITNLIAPKAMIIPTPATIAPWSSRIPVTEPSLFVARLVSSRPPSSVAFRVFACCAVRAVVCHCSSDPANRRDAAARTNDGEAKS